MMSVRIEELDKRKGRGVIATKATAKDEALLAVAPSIVVLYSQFVRQYCAACYSLISTNGEHHLCKDCFSFVLCHGCSTDEKWTNHQVACQWLCSLPMETQQGDTDYLRFCLELAARIQRGDVALLLSMDALASNEATQSDEVVNFCTRYSKLIYSTFSPRGMLVQQHSIYQALLKTKSNSLGFPFTPFDTLGWALHDVVCMLNHSCCPNAAIRNGKAPGSLELAALRGIREGEEVTISYLNLEKFSDVEARTRHLLEMYRFVCSCERCKTDRVASKRKKNIC